MRLIFINTVRITTQILILAYSIFIESFSNYGLRRTSGSIGFTDMSRNRDVGLQNPFLVSDYDMK